MARRAKTYSVTNARAEAAPPSWRSVLAQAAEVQELHAESLKSLAALLRSRNLSALDRRDRRALIVGVADTGRGVRALGKVLDRLARAH